MKAEQQLQIQQQVLDYFIDTDDKTMSSIIKCFVYSESTEDDKISKLIDKFIKDNGLTQAFINHHIDLKNPDSMWLRSSLSERDMIDQIHRAFLNLAFNRFAWLMDQPVKLMDQPVKKVRAKREIKLVEPQKIMLKYDENDFDVHVVSDLNDNYCMCGNATEGDFIKESILNVKDKVTCKNCLSIVNSAKKMKV